MMSSLSTVDISCYEYKQWHIKAKGLCILDQDVMPDVLRDIILEYRAPHPCSNQIKRFNRKRLRFSPSKPSIYQYLFSYNLRNTNVGYLRSNSRYSYAEAWKDHKKEDQEGVPPCAECSEMDQSITQMNQTMDRQLKLNIPETIFSLNFNMYRIPTLKHKQDLMQRNLYHPEGYGYYPLMHAIRMRYVIAEHKRNRARGIGGHLRFGKSW